MSAISPLKPSSVVLVSGGARGITAACVVKLAQHTPCKFILLGRTSVAEPQPERAAACGSDAELKSRIMAAITASGAKPTPQTIDRQFRQIRAQEEIEGTIASLKAAGSQVEYVDTDVSDSIENLTARLAGPQERLGKITGVIHGAGSLADRLIEKKTAKDFETVFCPKVDGLQNLLKVAPPANLDFLVLFSSVVGFFGNIGQADYAMANEILNKTAYQVKRDNPNCHVVAIDWGPWDAGMVTPELKRAFAARNMMVIPMASGAELMVREITGIQSPSEKPVQIVVGSLPTWTITELSGDLRRYEIHRQLSLDANPFLVDHMIGENPVLPATCAASWVASVCEQLYPGYLFQSLDNFKVLKGIVFDANLAEQHTLEIRETGKVPGEKVSFNTTIFSLNQKGNKIFHYTLDVTLAAGNPAVILHPLDEFTGPSALESGISGEKLYGDGTLFHGPAFQGVKRVLSLSKGRLVLECELPAISAEQQGQFPLQTTNPFVYDAIVQSLLIWTQEYYQAPCLPSYLERLDHYKAIPFDETCLVDMQIVSQSETAVVADIWVTDREGRVYVKFNRLQGTISSLLNRLIGKKETSIRSVVS
jgi:NAD(P)-dependent dehydrogenase (short-subunit alcohol dehydrogenase family)